MPQFDTHSSCFGCRAKCKGLDPCAQGAKTTQCAACSALTEEQWSHLRENFAKRSTYRQRTGSQGDSFEEPETEDPAQTGEDFSRVDDTLLDLEPEETVHLLPASVLSQAYRLHYLRKTSWRLLLLWVQLTSLRLHLQPFSGRRTPCLRQSHRRFFFQDLFHTQLLVDNQLWIEWLPCHSHNHRSLS